VQCSLQPFTQAKVTNTRRAADSIADLLPSDKEFRAKFEFAEEKGAAKARLLLIRLESQARAVKGKGPLSGVSWNLVRPSPSSTYSRRPLVALG